jgi:cupin superfamily acireductone dioxygenase involved in methionine salvage
MSTRRKSIDELFVVIDSEKNVHVEIADAEIYSRLEANYSGFRGCELLSCHSFEKDWDSWENHPHGDEVVLLLEGNVTFLLQLDNGQTSIVLEKMGSYGIVPQNTWHTAKVHSPSKVLFITPGEGTMLKDV